MAVLIGARKALIGAAAAGVMIARAAGLVYPRAAQAAVQAQVQAQTTDSVLEYRVKAAYLLNFTRYVEWPSEAHASASAPIVLCVHGINPFGRLLVGTVRGQTSRGRALEVRHTKAAADIAGCHVVFVSRAEWRRRPAVLAGLAKPGVLTVGEGPAFAEAGGVIGLVLEEGAVRFAINLAAGERAGLRLSSRMLSIASRVVHEEKADP
jgi:hypothetical protein